MAFWLAALLLALICGAWLARPLLGGRAAAAPRAAHDVQVFRDQLRAVERDVARGVLPEAEAAGARAEISRRLLAAAAEAERADPAVPAPAGASKALAAGLVTLLVAGGFGAYAMIGSPDLPDRPLAQRMAEIRAAEPPRPSQLEAEQLEAGRLAAAAPAPDAAPEDPETIRLRELVARLRGVLADRPDDVRGRRLLADSLLRLEDPMGAQAAMREAVDLQGDAVAPADRAALAETMILSAGGYVSPEAERQLGLTLQAEPSQPIARYYAGLALAQTGRYGLALRFWQALLNEGPEDAPWIEPIRAQIGGLERAAIAAGDMPAGGPVASAPPGPDAEQMQAAQDMSPEDRAAMIEDMVARLEGRLAEAGGPPADWARLISAYGVLGKPEDAARIWKDAEQVFADAPDALNRLRGAAVDAGVKEAME